MKITTTISFLLTLLFSVISHAKTEATVNGSKITTEMVQALQNQVQAQTKRQASKDEILSSLIRAEVVKQKAISRGYDKKPEIIKQVEDFKNRLLIDSFIKSLAEKTKITDKEYQQAYQKMLQHIPSKEYKARHILVKEEKQAKEIIKKTNAKNFAETAKAKSIGPSAKNGGALGWFNSKTMVKEFSNAVKMMKKGQVSKYPVKTQFGYHVILLEDIRETEKPSLESVKNELRNSLLQPKVLKQIEQMEKQANIKRF